MIAPHLSSVLRGRRKAPPGALPDQRAQRLPVLLLLHVLEIINQKRLPCILQRWQCKAGLSCMQPQNRVSLQQGICQRHLSDAAGRTEKSTFPRSQKLSNCRAAEGLTMMVLFSVMDSPPGDKHGIVPWAQRTLSVAYALPYRQIVVLFYQGPVKI